MTTLLKRNLKLYFRDRGSVFFSLLAVLIIIVLYAVFLGDVWLNDNMKQLADPQQLMDTWLAAGLLAVVSVTTTLGAFGVMVGDRASGIKKDFYASPIRRSAITAGYIGAALLIGLIMSVVALALAQGYILINGGAWLKLPVVLKTLALSLLVTTASTAMMCFVATFFKSFNSFAMGSTLVGTLIGFLTGIYLPIGALPNGVQWVIKLFPVSHAAALLRQTLMVDALAHSFSDVPAAFLEEFELYMGVRYEFGGTLLSPLGSVLILVGTALLFYALSLWRLSRRPGK